MKSKFTLEKNEISKNIKILQKFIEQNSLDAFYISSFDQFLNEYVPMIDCHRYYFSGFSGSVGEMMFFKDQKPRIYVDGRYYEQADLECDLSLIDVVKVPNNTTIMSALKSDLESSNVKTVGLEADRSSAEFVEFLNSTYQLKAFVNKELSDVISFGSLPPLSKISHLSFEVIGSTTRDKLNRIFTNETSAYYITAIDSLAWLSNCRGYHLPNLSSFLGRGFATRDKLYIFIDIAVEFDCNDPSVEFINTDFDGIEAKIKELQTSLELSRVFIDKKMLNGADNLMLKKIFSDDILTHKAGGLVEFHSIKDEQEIKVIKDAFSKADRAIFNTVSWIKEHVSNGEKISEKILHDKTGEFYKEEGAIELSFGTIAGSGANGSIIHYSDPKSDVFITPATMCLLDSGGYFEAGFATDTTRTFIGGYDQADEKQQLIYTLVLKGILHCLNAVFKAGTKGGGLDAICRQPLFQAGYDYAHGTGHGVGIHVHEGGVGIGPGRDYVLKPGHVVSIEPGIYLPGFGGVRLENIALVIDHPDFEGFLKFESLVYIGFDHALINFQQLTEQENKWLDEYEKICSTRGTSFLTN